MSDKKEKKMKSYHITFDDWKGTFNGHQHVDTAISKILKIVKDNDTIASSMPYLVVYEIGVTGKEHYHMYFHSQKCKNTLKKRLEKEIRTAVYFSDPSNPKYLKYETDGVLGVEIYLMKGKTNHMKSIDDLKVTPSVILANRAYYGHEEDSSSRLTFIRNKYEEQIDKMKKYKKEVAHITTERKKTEWEEILKDISVNPLHTTSDIKDYLSYQHYTKEKFNFTENGARNLYRKILKKIDINQYKNLVRNKLDLICD